MSLPHTTKAVCGRCKNEFEAVIWESVNVTQFRRRNYREKIRNMEFFTIKCPNCGLETALNYPCLYHDMERKTVIQILPSYIEDREDQVKQCAEMFHIFNGYELKRVVSSPLELAEKIDIQEAGFDDRLVELYKLIAFAIAGEETQLFQESDDNYWGEDAFFDGASLRISYPVKSGGSKDTIDLPFDTDLYNEIHDTLAKRLDAYSDEIEINSEWAYKVIEELEIDVAEEKETDYE